jgi:hypothetical protein
MGWINLCLYKANLWYYTPEEKKYVVHNFRVAVTVYCCENENVFVVPRPGVSDLDETVSDCWPCSSKCVVFNYIQYNELNTNNKIDFN